LLKKRKTKDFNPENSETTQTSENYHDLRMGSTNNTRSEIRNLFILLILHKYGRQTFSPEF